MPLNSRKILGGETAICVIYTGQFDRLKKTWSVQAMIVNINI